MREQEEIKRAPHQDGDPVLAVGRSSSLTRHVAGWGGEEGDWMHRSQNVSQGEPERAGRRAQVCEGALDAILVQAKGVNCQESVLMQL